MRRSLAGVTGIYARPNSLACTMGCSERRPDWQAQPYEDLSTWPGSLPLGMFRVGCTVWTSWSGL